MDQKMSSVYFSEEGTINNTVNFMKATFKAFEEQRDYYLKPNTMEMNTGDECKYRTGRVDNRLDHYNTTCNGGNILQHHNTIPIHSPGQEKKTFMFPWWVIIPGYVLIAAIILGSAFLTFFYSLEWGGTVSLEWLLSIFFSASASTFFIEPLKVSAIMEF